MCVYVCVYIYIYICMYVYMYVHSCNGMPVDWFGHGLVVKVLFCRQEGCEFKFQ